MQFSSSASSDSYGIVPPRAQIDIGSRDYMQERNNAVYQQRWQDTRAMPGCTGENIVLEHPTQTRSAFDSTTVTPPVSALSGEPMDANTFTHANMVPFFGSSISQNVDSDQNTSRMHMHTGTKEFATEKHEISPLFDSQRDMSHVYGTPSQPDSNRDRFFQSTKRQGEKPFESTRVGPGINAGYTAAPSGGFQQSDSREHIMPKTVDELRTATNPKVTYQEPVIPGKATVLRRGIYGEFAKNKPDRHYKNSPARYMTTVGAVTGRRHRSQPIDKLTNRQFRTREHTGAGGPGTGQQTRSSQRVTGYSAPFKEQHGATGLRNAASTGAWNAKSEQADYGKDGMEAKPNERDSTQKSRYLSSAVGLVKALIAPVQDAIRTTRKENVMGNPRQAGNMQSRVKRAPAKDPSDVARTTVKELNVHNAHEGFVGSVVKALQAHDPNDVTRTTIKQTNVHDARTGNMGGHQRHIVYDPNDIAKVTIKETNIHNARDGAISTVVSRSQAYDPSDVAATTIKETNIHNTRDGAMGSVVRKGQAYDPSDVAATTIKETNIHNSRDGALNTVVRRSQAYDPSDVAATTIKETNIHNTRDGAMGSVLRKGQAYDPNDVAATTIKETNIHDTRDGAMKSSAMLRGMVYDPNDIMPTTVKDTNIHNEREGAMGSIVRKTVAYDPGDVAKTTIKETQIHDTRTGHMSAQPSATGEGSHTEGVSAPHDKPRVTTRQTMHTEDDARNLAAPDVHKSVVYDPNDIARTTTRQTMVQQPRTANADAQAESGTGYLTNPKEAPTTSRQFVSTVEYTGDADGPEVGGYQVAETEAPATQRQEISDKEYAGTAKCSEDKPMSYTDVYNATMNEVKEQVAEGRQPTFTSQKVSTGMESVNLDVRPQVSEEESSREWTKTKEVTRSGQDVEAGESTRNLNTLQTNDGGDAPDPSLLEAFRQNPLTQPLDSAAL